MAINICMLSSSFVVIIERSTGSVCTAQSREVAGEGKLLVCVEVSLVRLSSVCVVPSVVVFLSTLETNSKSTLFRLRWGAYLSLQFGPHLQSYNFSVVGSKILDIARAVLRAYWWRYCSCSLIKYSDRPAFKSLKLKTQLSDYYKKMC